MDMKGEQLIRASHEATWTALNDPNVLKECIPGCESIEPTSPYEYQILMVARVGPVSARFRGTLTLSNVNPPTSYVISFEGQGGTAGFGKGSAKVHLSPEGQSTRLSYEVRATVGGKLAQIGSRLVDAAAKKIASDFFDAFNQRVEQFAVAQDSIRPTKTGRLRNILLALVIATCVILLIWQAVSWA